MQHEQLCTGLEDLDRSEVPGHDARAPRARVFIHAREGLSWPTVVRLLRPEVIGSHLVPLLRAAPPTRPVRQPPPAPVRVFLRHFEPFPPPQAFHPLVIHVPPFAPEEPGDAPIAIPPALGRQGHQAVHQPRFVRPALPPDAGTWTAPAR